MAPFHLLTSALYYFRTLLYERIDEGVLTLLVRTEEFCFRPTGPISVLAYSPFCPRAYVSLRLAQGSRKFRQELGRAVQAQSKVDPETQDFREAVECAMALLPDESLDEPVGDPPDDARSTSQ